MLNAVNLLEFLIKPFWRAIHLTEKNDFVEKHKETLLHLLQMLLNKWMRLTNGLESGF